uniref:Agenet domain-containing protein n=1 Tax=Populus trichocarpa TaxID=3694 RepID=A0A3N7FYJ9_POPTR
MAPKSKSNQDPNFKPGSKVEIMSDEAGFRGSFYIGTVVKATRTPEFTVRYEKLFEDEEGTKPLQETVNEFQIRPIAPREKKREFKFSEEVDAFHNDGWWEGVITEVNENGKFAVFFRSTKEQIEFVEEDLRLHREWVNGEWKPPLDGEEEKGEIEEVKEKGNKKVPNTTPVKPIESLKDVKFSKGMLVEVSSDEDGFKGAWFAASIVEPVGKDKYLVEYKSLRTEDDSGFLREEVNTMHIRPPPPQTVVVDHFKKLEEVDALYNDVWWVGVVSKVNTFPKYVVYFKDNGEELEFKHSDLRPHQDWINGKWVAPSHL